MKKFSARQVRILKMTHIIFFIMWFGGFLCITAVMFVAQPAHPDDIYMKCRTMEIIDNYVLIPGALGSLFTGLVYSIWTNWGFFKHRWITFKWIMTTAQILFGTFALGPWIDRNVILSGNMRGAALSNPEFINNILMIKIWGTVQGSLLLFLIVISVIKPWKRNTGS